MKFSLTSPHSFRPGLHIYAQDVISSAKDLNTIQFILMAVEGIVAASFAALFILFITLKLTGQRYNLYSVFMVVPVSLLKRLAAKSSQLDEADLTSANGSPIASDAKMQYTDGGMPEISPPMVRFTLLKGSI